LLSTIIGDLNSGWGGDDRDVLKLASNFNVTAGARAEGGCELYGAITIGIFIDVAAHFGQSLSGALRLTPEEERW